MPLINSPVSLKIRRQRLDKEATKQLQDSRQTQRLETNKPAEAPLIIRNKTHQQIASIVTQSFHIVFVQKHFTTAEKATSTTHPTSRLKPNEDLWSQDNFWHDSV